MTPTREHKLRVYLETFGCQMNDYDSARMLRLLLDVGYEQAGEPKDADVLIFNTCSVRDKAEQKALSRIGRFKKLRKLNPQVKFVLAGCFAQRSGQALLRQMPYLNLVLGTGAIDRLPELLQRLDRGAKSLVDIELDNEKTDPATDFGGIVPGKGSPASAFVTCMQGCNNFCAYCIVPYVRGRERSRPADQVFEEVRGLVEHGVREITLLGQNVNSYDGGGVDFADLLRRIHQIDELVRIRFTTSHPKDCSDRLIDAFAELPKLADHLHLPVQAGSNDVLKRMKRGYTAESYLEKVDKLCQARPGIVLTSDFLVGFPGETEVDFQQTMDLLRKVRYSNVFSFRYSVRPGTAAADLDDDVPEETKIARLMELQQAQREITLALHREMAGKTVEVLVDGEQNEPSRPQWSGKSSCYREVHFDGVGITVGDMVTVEIEKAYANSLRGIVKRKK